mmetsp:Transcript_5270/g.16908  ORF Transcript_5270/g.16908 Transcript_5270/m.16908 type:complete len:289 (+) Transcript_5270:2-868(+)
MDAPGSTVASVKIVNDLDLTLIGPDGVQYFPNLGTQRDPVNTVEHIEVPTDLLKFGVWRARVTARSLPLGLPQPYSLVISGPIEIDSDLVPVGTVTSETGETRPFFVATDTKFGFVQIAGIVAGVLLVLLAAFIVTRRRGGGGAKRSATQVSSANPAHVGAYGGGATMGRFQSIRNFQPQRFGRVASVMGGGVGQMRTFVSQRFQGSPVPQAPSPVIGSYNSGTTGRASGGVVAGVHPDALPPGWKRATDAKTGAKYYYNRKTKQVSWEPPQMPASGPGPKKKTFGIF